MVYIDDLAELIRRLIDEGTGGVFHPQTFIALHRGPRPRPSPEPTAAAPSSPAF